MKTKEVGVRKKGRARLGRRRLKHTVSITRLATASDKAPITAQPSDAFLREAIGAAPSQDRLSKGRKGTEKHPSTSCSLSPICALRN